jgi:hypothetical protein
MAECGTCDRWFNSWHAATQHMKAVGHLWECDYCDLGFYYEHHLEQHIDEEGHDGPRYDCEACDVWYDNYPHAKWHMNTEGHWRKHYCESCQKGFESENNLKAVRTALDLEYYRVLTMTSISTARSIEARTSRAHSASVASQPPQELRITLRPDHVPRLAL